MYDTLRPELITCTERERNLLREDPSYVLSWEIFQHNAFPYLEVRRPFILGTAERRWKATLAHRFAELVHTQTQTDNSKLTRVYTQNIDGLERQCEALPPDKIFNLHGSLAQVACEGCGAAVEFDDFCESLKTNIKDIYGVDPDAPAESTPIQCRNCGKALVKPTTVLIGRNLPEEFYNQTEADVPHADLLIIAGTSLAMFPANSLVFRVPETTKRVLINREMVGRELGLGHPSFDDIVLLGSCEEIFWQLIQALGWTDDVDVTALPEASRKMIEQDANYVAGDKQ